MYYSKSELETYCKHFEGFLFSILTTSDVNFRRDSHVYKMVCLHIYLFASIKLLLLSHSYMIKIKLMISTTFWVD